MTAFLIILAMSAALGCFGAGALSPDRGLAVEVAWSRVRYATGPAEITAGFGVTLAAALACAAGGAAYLLALAAREGCRLADQAAAQTMKGYT